MASEATILSIELWAHEKEKVAIHRTEGNIKKKKPRRPAEGQSLICWIRSEASILECITLPEIFGHRAEQSKCGSYHPECRT